MGSLVDQIQTEERISEQENMLTEISKTKAKRKRWKKAETEYPRTVG